MDSSIALATPKLAVATESRRFTSVLAPVETTAFLFRRAFILFALTILFIENYIKTNKKIFLFGLLAISTLIANIHVAVWPFYFVLFLPYIELFQKKHIKE